ncbi:MAG: ROK family protein [Eubacteriales bacterium]|jgi:hypothetical protein|nr:ROK family transcriptional regulator [Clostridiales bacterium]
MERVSLYSIMSDSIKNIYSIISESDNISRLEISRKTSLSLMTVGKVVDSLLELGVIRQIKEKRTTAGRKAGLVSANNEYYSVVLDISTKEFVMTVVDVSLCLVDTLTYTYNRNYYYDENFYLFLKNVASYLSRQNDTDKLIGIGITVPGTYVASEDRVVGAKIPELSSIPILETAKRILKRDVNLVIRNVEAAAIAGIKKMPELMNSIVIYMFVGDTVDGALLWHGKIQSGAHGFACDFGNMSFHFGDILENRVSGCTSFDDLIQILACAIYNIIIVIDPKAIMLECEIPYDPGVVIASVKNTMQHHYKLPEMRIPEFIFSPSAFRRSNTGVTFLMRNAWLDSLIK